jgi:hypothetical protein
MTDLRRSVKMEYSLLGTRSITVDVADAVRLAMQIEISAFDVSREDLERAERASRAELPELSDAQMAACLTDTPPEEWLGLKLACQFSRERLTRAAANIVADLHSELEKAPSNDEAGSPS